MSTPTSITAVAPGKVILFGEHAINRGQPALATAVGLFARCTARTTTGELIHFRSRERTSTATAQDLEEIVAAVDAARERETFDVIRTLCRSDYFAPQKYVLGHMLRGARVGLELNWDSQVPSSSGLGSGGSAFVSMVAAVAALVAPDLSAEQRAAFAHRGDIVAHGGIASALDTQTSLVGGVIQFDGQGLAVNVPVAPGLTIVVGNTRIHAATGEVNGGVRAWLNERPRSRITYFKTIGALTRAAIALLARGDWDELGRLMNLNQLVLEKIGVSRPQIDRLIDAALDAGAFGAKISGSGGGGIIIALVAPDTATAVADAITHAGGDALVLPVAVPGVQLEHQNQSTRT